MRIVGLVICFLFWGIGFLHARPPVDHPDLERHFSKRGIEGCFVALDQEKNVLHVYNRQRANTRFNPASTFKIPNALIALEVGAASSIDEVIPYGGTKEYLSKWEQDMNLRDAMKVSNVAVFHQLAKRTGMDRMKRFVEAFGYGNQSIGTSIDQRFWLKGPLEISAVEQVDFLRRITTGDLPLRAETIKAISDLILQEGSGPHKVYAKTGWVGPGDPEIGWWVGWVDVSGRCYPFALNIAIKSNQDATHRIPIGMECLQSLGILPGKE